MDHIFHRNPAHDYPVAVAGDGAWIIDAQGRRYLDACGGAAVSCLGHSDHDVAAAMRAQLERIAYTHTSFFTSEPAEQLAELLVSGAPGMGRAYFVSSGSEAMEGALKLARQVWLDRPAMRTATGATARMMKPTDNASWPSWSRPSSSSARAMSWPSSPRLWSARRWVPRHRCPATCAGCAISATATGSC